MLTVLGYVLITEDCSVLPQATWFRSEKSTRAELEKIVVLLSLYFFARLMWSFVTISNRKIYLISRKAGFADSSLTCRSFGLHSEPIAKGLTLLTANHNQIPAFKFIQVCLSTPPGSLIRRGLTLTAISVWSQMVPSHSLSQSQMCKMSVAQSRTAKNCWLFMLHYYIFQSHFQDLFLLKGSFNDSTETCKVLGPNLH